jgi:hypothetical protein
MRSRRATSDARSLFPERAARLIGEWLEHVGQHGALVGANERLDRHAGHKLQSVETTDLLGRHGDAHEIIGLPGALVLDGVGCNPAHAAVELGRAALVEAGEAQRRRLPELDLIDFLRVDPHLDDEVVMLRGGAEFT